MIDLLGYAPIAAAGFAVPQFLPQIRKLRATGDSVGVSPSWAALTSVNNAAWIAYFTMARYWTALVPSSSATLLAGTLAVMLLRRQQPRPRPGPQPGRAAALIGAWVITLAAAGVAAAGRPGRAAHRGVSAPGHALSLDGVPNGLAHRHLLRNVAAHPGRAHLLDDLRPAHRRPAADHPGRQRDNRQRPHARPDPPDHGTPAWTSPSRHHRQCTWFATARDDMEAVTPAVKQGRGLPSWRRLSSVTSAGRTST